MEMRLKIAPAKLTPEALIDLPIPDEVQISPDGKQIVYSLRPLGKKGRHVVSSLWIADVGKEFSARQLTSGLYNDRHPRWCPDGTSIAFLSDRSAKGGSCAIHLIHLGGGEAFALTKADNKRDITTFEWSPDGNFIAYLSPDETTSEKEAKLKDRDDVKVFGADWEYNRLRLLHVSSQTVTTLYEKENHVSRLVWNSNTSKEIMYVLHDTPELDSPSARGAIIELVTIMNRQSWHVCHFPGQIKSPMSWWGTEVWFLGGTAPDKCNTSTAVYRLTTTDSSWSRVGYGNESCAVGMCGAASNQEEVFVKVEAELSDCIEVLYGKPIYTARHEISTWDAFVSETGNKCVIALGRSTVSMPTEIYTLEMPSDKRFGHGRRGAALEDLVQLSSHGKAIADLQLGSSQNLRCASSDGSATIHGLYFSPSSVLTDNPAHTKPLPTIVYIHGGPYGRTNNSFNPAYFHWSSYLLASDKYGMLFPNYRGGSSQGEAFAAQARGKMGTVDYDDILALVDKGIKRGLVDKDKIIIAGWSQGGFLSFLSAVRNGKQDNMPRFQGAICGAGVVDFDMLTMTSDTPTYESELAGGSPWTSAKNDFSARRGSAIWELNSAKDVPPILILHGEVDERVPLSQSKAFYRACLTHSIPCEMAIYPREGHIISERHHLLDMLKRVRKFCDMHLGK